MEIVVNNEQLMVIEKEDDIVLLQYALSKPDTIPEFLHIESETDGDYTISDIRQDLPPTIDINKILELKRKYDCNAPSSES